MGILQWHTTGREVLVEWLQYLLIHWQCPAALAALGICCKLVKAICLQATLIYPRVLVRHSSNHRSRRRLAWFLLFSPNPQMHFVLSDNGRSTEPELKLQGNVRTVVSLWLWVSGKQRQGMRKGKGTEKKLKGLCIMQCFGAKTCYCFSKATA